MGSEGNEELLLVQSVPTSVSEAASHEQTLSIMQFPWLELSDIFLATYLLVARSK
jgi:hypothetical protein